MKIAVISSQVFAVPLQGYGGLEYVAYHCARGLAGLGHEVSLFAPDGSQADWDGRTVPAVVHTGPCDGNEERAYGGYWQRLLQYDVVIDHSWNKWPLMLKAEGVLKAPVLSVMHAPVNTMYQSLPPVERPCFVCISEDQAQHFEALHGRPAHFVYNGIDPDFYRAISVPRTDRFLFLGRFSSIKGADLAIRACKEVGVGLDLVGDTTITGEPQYLEHCRAQCDGKQIKLHPGCSRGEAVWWYSKAHAFLHPNQRFREPFGLAPVEAMACGNPVIAWDYGAVKETVLTGETGWLVKSYEELVKAVKSYAVYHFGDQDRDRCRKQALNFTLERNARAYEELCEEALTTGGW